MLDDTTTTTTFPSEHNHCLHCKFTSIPSSEQQANYCLTPDYVYCPIHAQTTPTRLPAKIRWQHEPIDFRPAFLKTALAVFFSGLLVMFFLLGAPARISSLIQAFDSESAHEVYQPVVFTTRTPTADARTPYRAPTSSIGDIVIPTSIPITQIVKLTVIELEMGAYCRSGPDTSFSSITVVKSGDVLQALAMDSAGKYYLVREIGRAHV